MSGSVSNRSSCLEIGITDPLPRNLSQMGQCKFPYQVSRLQVFILFHRVHGLAAIQAYEIYQSQVMLDLAVDSWVFGRAYTISEGEASRGKSEVKNFTLNGPCGGGESNYYSVLYQRLTLYPATLAGGTFWVSHLFSVL